MRRTAKQLVRHDSSEASGGAGRRSVVMKYSKFSPLAALVMSASVLGALTIDFNTQPIGWVGKPELSTSNLAAAGGLLFDVRFTIKDQPGPTETGYDANNYHADDNWSGDL